MNLDERINLKSSLSRLYTKLEKAETQFEKSWFEMRIIMIHNDLNGFYRKNMYKYRIFKNVYTFIK
jgi:hypothetical protein